MLGIIGAMPEEIYLLKDHIDIAKEVEIGNRLYIQGKMYENNVVLVFSRWGKVAAASTTTTLINKFNCSSIIFTGVAGAVDSSLNIGDIVLGSSLYQHDLDARPLYKQFQIPLTSKSFIKATYQLDKFEETIKHFLVNIREFVPEQFLRNFSIANPILKKGIIASGDQFINSPLQHSNLNRNEIPVLAVEMEGAAVAQVCDDYNIPFVIIRTISDKSDSNSPIDFKSFVETVAGPYSVGIINNFVKDLA